MDTHPDAIAALQRELADAPPHDIVRHALERFGDDLLLSFSGAEDVLLVDIAAQVARRPVRVLTLDTGRLHPETLEFLQTVRDRYDIVLEVRSPDREEVEALVRDKGLFSFLRDGHAECCAVRKVGPLRRALAGCRAWMTGQRRDQSPETRGELPVVQLDPSFRGAGGPLLKYNPLANWSSERVWRYLRSAGIPHNPLHARGYVSIGCAPCTRPVLPGQHEREGRWWWEQAEHKECGLHLGEGG